MTKNEIEHMWKVASNNPNHDTNWHDPVVIAFVELIEAKRQAEIDSLHALYEQACKQRDEVMDWQRAMIANMRGQMQ